MLKIYQGGNSPIKIRFTEDASSFTYISAGLYSGNVMDKGEEMKRWDKANMTIASTDVSLPMTQSESKAFKKGKAILLVKYRKSTNPVVIIKEIEAEIVARYDGNVSLGEN